MLTLVPKIVMPTPATDFAMEETAWPRPERPAETAELMAEIRGINGRGYTVLLIEHDMRLVMSLCDRILVLSRGRVAAEFTPANLTPAAFMAAAFHGFAAPAPN